jgi:hypothetical protein
LAASVLEADATAPLFTAMVRAGRAREQALYDSPVIRGFAGVDPAGERVPDETSREDLSPAIGAERICLCRCANAASPEEERKPLLGPKPGREQWREQASVSMISFVLALESDGVTTVIE